MVVPVSRRFRLVGPRRAVLMVLAATSVITSAVVGGVVSTTNAVEPAPAQPALPSSAEIATDQHGNWSIVGAAPENVLTQAKPDADPVQTATDIVADYADGLGIADPGSALTPQPVRELDDGGKVVRFDQNVSGIPVFASGIAVRLTPDNEALSVSSTIVATDRTAGMDLAPTIDQAGAIELARTAVASDLAIDPDDPDAESADAENPDSEPAPIPGIDPNQLIASTPEMMVYDATLVGGDPNAEVLNGPRLVWSLSLASPDEFERYRVLIDAVDPTVLLVYSEVESARKRRVCDYGNSTSSQTCRDEGGSAVPGKAVLNRAFDISSETYAYFKDYFGRDSYDNRGAKILINTRVCRVGAKCPLRDSHWTGKSMWLGAGYGNADDVITHEFTHGVIQHEANLAYYAESGAILESFADVFGELVDQRYNFLGTDTPSKNWLIGEDTVPFSGYGEFRSLKHPPAFGDPDRVMHMWYKMTPWWNDNMGVHSNAGVGNKAAYLISFGGNFNGFNVPGIGNRKTGAIYYEALTSVLTPGSDWVDLYQGLYRACRNLVGKPLGSQSIVATDCDSVAGAVQATQMDKANQRRLTTLPLCPTGRRTNFFGDDAERGMAKWVTNSGKWAWRPSKRASQSGAYSFYGENPAGTNRNGTSYSTWMRTSKKIKIPWTGTSYLWFDHSFDIENTWDGGVVEYSTDGQRWTDLGSKGAVHGYNGKVANFSKSPVHGRAAFTGKSRGFQQTKLSLAKLRGRRVFIRFRIGADGTGRGAGWNIDDVTVYNCTTSFAKFRTGYQPITPKRLIDTRSSKGLVKARGMRPAGKVLRFNARKLGIYQSGHKPTALNLTITSVGNTAPGHVTAYPCGKRPKTSTLNATDRGSIVVNTATIPISAKGEICIYTHARTHLLVDVAGYETSEKGSAPPSRYQKRTPRRVVDTRKGSGLVPVKGRRRAGSTLEIDVSNLGIFSADTTPRALDLTFTMVNNSGAGHITAYPCGKRPNTSLLNGYKPRQVVSNTATVPVSSNDKICVYTATATDLIIDVTGYYSDTQGPVLARYRPRTPKRVVDTRNSEGLYKIKGLRPAGSTLRINMNKLGIQKSGDKPTAYDLTFTMILNQGPGHITAYPCGKRPTASTINATRPSMVIANTATIPVSSSGEICIYTHTKTHLAIDVTGYHFT